MNFVNQARIKALEEWMTSLITDPRYFKAVNAYPAIVTRILSICEVCMDQKCANIARAMLTCVNHANLLDTYKKRITTAMKDNGIDLGKQQELDEELKETTRQAKALKVHEQDDGEDEDVDMDRSSKRSRRD